MLTQSIYSLLFAVLGPVVAVGGLVDGRVGRRRAARRDRARYLAALDRTAAAVAEAHEPRAAAARAPAPAGGGRRMGRTRGGPVPVRVGRGTIAGRVELSGEEPEDAPDEVAAALRDVRAAAAELRDAPIVVDARDGIGVVGPAGARRRGRPRRRRRGSRRDSRPSTPSLTAPPGEPWTEQLPHAVVAGEPGRYEFRDGRRRRRSSSRGRRARRISLPGCGILITPRARPAA